jgi:hypothetical protein
MNKLILSLVGRKIWHQSIFHSQQIQKCYISKLCRMKLLSMGIIFAQETMGPSLSWPTPDASQKVAS